MAQLRNLSSRPEILVDNQGFRLVDAASSRIGTPGPLGRQRIVTAITLNEAETGPVQLVPSTVTHDNELFYLADPAGNLIGDPGVWVHRMLYARWVQDTRRVSG
jgi:hypothetical protein